MNESREIVWPDGKKSTARKEADRLGLSIQGMNWRIRTWGLNDPRTFAKKDDIPREKKSKHDGVVYKCPFFQLAGTVEECAKALGIGESNFKVRLRDFGGGAPQTWFNQEQAEAYRVLRAFANRGCQYVTHENKLMGMIKHWKGKFRIAEGGILEAC